MGNKERENGNRLSSHGLAALIVDALVDAGLVVLQQHLAPNVAEFARIQFRFIKRNARILANSATSAAVEVEKKRFDEAVEAATVEIDVRKELGDY